MIEVVIEKINKKPERIPVVLSWSYPEIDGKTQKKIGCTVKVRIPSNKPKTG